MVTITGSPRRLQILSYIDEYNCIKKAYLHIQTAIRVFRQLLSHLCGFQSVLIRLLRDVDISFWLPIACLFDFTPTHLYLFFRGRSYTFLGKLYWVFINGVSSHQQCTPISRLRVLLRIDRRLALCLVALSDGTLCRIFSETCLSRRQQNSGLCP
jgi:hypothetical protein